MMDQNKKQENKRSDRPPEVRDGKGQNPHKLQKKNPQDRFATLQSALAVLSQAGHKYQFDALVAIRKRFTKDQNGVAAFRQQGGIKRLLEHLSSHTCNNKSKDVALSIMGNCCMDEKCRKEVLWKDGIPTICEIVMTVEEESIQNRACRTLGNLALDSECCSTIHQQEEILHTIIKLLNNTTDNDTRMTYARTIRLLGDTASHQRAVVAAEGVRPLGELLKLDNEPLITAGLKGITELTKSIADSVARQLIAAEVPSSLLQLTSHSNSTISLASENLMLNYVKHEELRPSIGAAGGIKYFIDKVSHSETANAKKLTMVNALCLCCHDSVNRYRMRNSEGLELLMQVLKDQSYHLIHNRIISAMVCFLYDDASLEILLSNGIVDELLCHLRRIAKLGRETEDVLKFPFLDIKVQESERCDKNTEQENLVTGTDHQVQDTGQPSPTSEVIEDIAAVQLESSHKQVSEGQTMGEMLESVLRDNTSDSKADVKDDLKRTTSNTSKDQNIESERTFEETDQEDDPDNKVPSPGCSKGSHVLPSVTGVSKDTEESTASSSASRDKEDDSESADSRTILTTPLPNISILAPKDETVDLENSTVSDTSKNTLKESHSEPALSKPVKYSIDSPTYKEISEWKFDDYFIGPKNIHESAQYNWANSPEMIMPPQSPPRNYPYSPLSTGSADWSPEHSPVCSPSPPHRLLHAYSPLSSPSHSPLMHGSPAASYISTESHSPQWSPTNLHNSPLRLESPSGSPSREDSWYSPWWCMPALNETTLHYSSDEETDPSGPAEKVTTLISESNSCQSSGSGKTCDLERSASEALDFPLVPSCPVVTSEDTSVISTSKRVRRESKEKQKKKTHTSPAAKLKILKQVERSSSSSVDLDKMLLDMPQTPESSHGHMLELSTSHFKDPVKVTEHNVLVILSRISYFSDPSKYLVTVPVWTCLLDYVGKCRRPLPRAERILIRLSRNPLCFEAMIQKMMPFLVMSHLSYLQNKPDIHCMPDECIEDSTYESAKDSDKKVTFTIGGDKEETSNKSSETSSKELNMEADKVKLRKDALARLEGQLSRNMVLLAESKYGQGVLAHNLLKKPPLIQQQCSVSLAYIYQSPDLRRKMYISMEGLSKLHDAISSSSGNDMLQVKALYSLLQLAVELNITVPTYQDKKHPINDLTHFMAFQLGADCDVTFIMSDGMKIKGYRKWLAAASQVFAAMLQGHYAERDQQEVSINHVLAPAFQILVNYLHETGKQKADIQETNMAVESRAKAQRTERTPAPTKEEVTPESDILTSPKKCIDFDTSLELLGLADRYMLETLQHLVVVHLTRNFLTIENVIEVCQFSLLHNCNELTENCLAYILSGVGKESEHMKLLSQIYSSPQHHQILLMLKDLIKTYLSH